MKEKDKENDKRRIAEMMIPIAKIWYLITPIVVYILSELDNIINKSCNWCLFFGCLAFLILAQLAAKYFLENTDGGTF